MTLPDWHFKPPDQQILDAPPRLQEYRNYLHSQRSKTRRYNHHLDYNSLWLQHQNQLRFHSSLPTAGTTTETTTTTPAQTTTTTSSTQDHYLNYACEERLVSNYRHRSSTLEYQRGLGGKKLSLDNMHLQEWYDDDNTTHYRRQMCSPEYKQPTTVNNNSKKLSSQNG
eukprot:3678532-Amphidinium_carterae.1